MLSLLGEKVSSLLTTAQIEGMMNIVQNLVLITTPSYAMSEKISDFILSLAKQGSFT